MSDPRPSPRAPRPRALVTGGSRGIGAAIVRELCAAGHPIVLNYREGRAAAVALADELGAAGHAVELCPFDVADRAAAAAAIARLQDGGAPIGVVVNNAGVTADGPLGGMRDEAWDRVLAVTLDGFYNVTRPLIMPMVGQRWGRIVNVASIAGLVGNRGQVNYAAAKAGLIGATKALALEVARRGVTVNAVAPGLIDTDMIAGLPPDGIERIPMRRLGRADEVARLVGFLCSDAAGYVTKQVIAIDGGLA